MNEVLAWAQNILPRWPWVGSVFLVVLATVVANYIARRLLLKLARRLGQTRTHWDDVLIEAARRPLGWGIWILGIGYAADVVRDATDAALFVGVDTLREIGILVTLVWFVLRFIRGAEQEIIASGGAGALDRHTAEAIGKLLRLSVIITAVLVILQTLGYSITGVLAFGGVGGIAIGFAAKDLLANFFGAMIIYLDRPFQVGDWIRSPDKQLEGTVEKIGWRVTVIRTFDKRPLYVPNAVFTSIIVENPSRMTNRRIYETIGIRYDDIAVMDDIVESVKKMLREDPEIDTSQTMIVNFNKFSDSSVDFFVYTFTKTTNWVRFHEIKQEVLLKIADIIRDHGAEIAFPTTTVLLQQQETECNDAGEAA